jgi:hypothetical protein
MDRSILLASDSFASLPRLQRLITNETSSIWMKFGYLKIAESKIEIGNLS